MLESLINSLDNRGVMAVQALLGKRCLELLQPKILTGPVVVDDKKI